MHVTKGKCLRGLALEAKEIVGLRNGWDYGYLMCISSGLSYVIIISVARFNLLTYHLASSLHISFLESAN